MGEQWTVDDVAAHLGVARKTVLSYRARRQMPPADGILGRTPWWHPETIRAWNAARPGMGIGGGRPRRPRA